MQLSSLIIGEQIGSPVMCEVTHAAKQVELASTICVSGLYDSAHLLSHFSSLGA